MTTKIQAPPQKISRGTRRAEVLRKLRRIRPRFLKKVFLINIEGHKIAAAFYLGRLRKQRQT